MYLLKDLINLFTPYRCLRCKVNMGQTEYQICHNCKLHLEQTLFFRESENPLEKLFWGRIDIFEAASLYYYQKGTAIQSLIKALKYENNQKIGVAAANHICRWLPQSDRFNQIDIVTIVPLHPLKKQQRGYNQVEKFGFTLAKFLTAKFIPDLLIKKNDMGSQTQLKKEERYEHTQKQYLPNPKYSKIENHNLLLVDDVITTGATILACAKALKKKHQIQLSVISIAFTI